MLTPVAEPSMYVVAAAVAAFAAAPIVSQPFVISVPDVPTTWQVQVNSARSSADDSPDAVVNAPVAASAVPNVPCVVSIAAANVNVGVPVLEITAAAVT